MDREKALDKIRKCLALSRSANAHEAAAAMRQAQALMRQHGLDDQDVALAEVAERAVDSRMQSLPLWEAMLATTIAEAFGCVLHATNRWRLGRTLSAASRRQFRFIGVGAAAEVAAYAYDVLSRQCARGRLAHIQVQPKACKPITRTARGDEWARGWVIGVHEHIQAAAGNAQHTALLESYVQRKYPELGKVKPENRAVGRNVRRGSVTDGFEAGQQARLDKGIGNTKQPELLK